MRSSLSLTLIPPIFIPPPLPPSTLTREIDEVEFPVKFLLGFHVFLFDVDEENTMGSRTMLVHVGNLHTRCDVTKDVKNDHVDVFAKAPG